MSVRAALRRWADRIAGDPFERALDAAAREHRDRVVFYWNRGLGDIALGLVPMFARVRERLPGAAIEVVTRTELVEPFRLTDAAAIHAVPGLVREGDIGADAACARLPVDPRAGALAIGRPDPTRWLAGARAPAPPRLRWNASLESLAAPFVDPTDTRPWIAVHAHTETARHYRTVKDWPADRWRALFAQAAVRSEARFVLLGHGREPALDGPNVVDLRGRTRFLELLALVRTRCRGLVAPDGGILNAVYFLDADFPITVVSLWADPRQGLLKNGAISPNPRLEHVAITAPGGDLGAIGAGEVLAALAPALERREDRP